MKKGITENLSTEIWREGSSKNYHNLPKAYLWKEKFNKNFKEMNLVEVTAQSLAVRSADSFQLLASVQPSSEGETCLGHDHSCFRAGAGIME